MYTWPRQIISLRGLDCTQRPRANDIAAFVRKVIFVRAHNKQRRGKILCLSSPPGERGRVAIEGLTEGVVCLPVAITRDEGPSARIFRIILPYKRLSRKLIAPTAHAKPNKCNRAHRLYRCEIVADRARNQTRKFPTGHRTIKQRRLIAHGDKHF